MVKKGPTIRSILNQGFIILKQYTDIPKLEASVILSHVLGKEDWYLIAHEDELVSNEVANRYFSLINQRLNGMPVQYIIGHQEFMALDFIVNQSVLIPRPETEVLVEEIIEYISHLPKDETIYIADIGTGSGCIGISILRYTTNTYVIATDISDEALRIARRNAELLGVTDRIEFICCDLFTGIKSNNLDVIVSNPPYIPTEEIEKLQIEVKKFEPRIALDGGGDGLEFYRRIINEGYLYLKPGGLLALEIGFNQADPVKSLVERNGNYSSFRIIKDLAQKDRVVVMRRI